MNKYKRAYPDLFRNMSDHFGPDRTTVMLEEANTWIVDSEFPDTSIIFENTSQGNKFWYDVCKELRTTPTTEYWEKTAPRLFRSMSEVYGVKRTTRLLGGVRKCKLPRHLPYDDIFPRRSFQFENTKQGVTFWTEIENTVKAFKTKKVSTHLPLLLNTMAAVYGVERSVSVFVANVANAIKDHVTPDGAFLWKLSGQGLKYWEEVQETLSRIT